jgi:integrase
MVIQNGYVNTRTATLIIRYKDAFGTWKRAAAVRGANGRIRPGYAHIGGREEPVEEYQYQIRYYEDRKLRYEPAGTKAGAADALRDRIEKRVSARAAAEDAGLKVEAEETRKTLLVTAAAYIRDAERRGAMEAAAQARNVRDEFLRTVRKTYVDEITRDDVFRFHETLRNRRCSDRTVANKHQRLTSWLRFAGVDKTILPPVPRYEERLPTIYDRDQISTLLANADSAKRVMILLGLKLGLRDQELQHAAFGDLDWTEKTFRVQGKPKWGFRPKTWEQRDIPIPDDLLTELKTWKKGRSDRELILGTVTGRPNGKLLLALKTLARKAKLNCGHCTGCKGKNRQCQEYTLHRFRRTYITTLLRNGVDLRTVQAYAGHKDISSTMRYLRPASAKEAQAKLNAIEW